jgi:hypothetical protein
VTGASRRASKPIDTECSPLLRIFVFFVFFVVIDAADDPDAPETSQGSAARGKSLAAFDGRCILAGCVAPPSNIPDILSRRALPARRLGRLGATPDFHHGLLGNVAKNLRKLHFSEILRLLFSASIPPVARCHVARGGISRKENDRWTFCAGPLHLWGCLVDAGS